MRALFLAAGVLALAACAQTQAQPTALHAQAAPPQAPSQPEPALFPLPVVIQAQGKEVKLSIDADGKVTGDLEAARAALKEMPRSCGLHCLLIAVAVKAQIEGGKN